MTSIRTAHKELTRGRILDAARALVCEDNEDSVTIAAVAARAGVTHRTVYRHFETREDLLRTVWARIPELVGPEGAPESADELIATPLLFFPQLDEERELVSAYLLSRERHRAHVRSGQAGQEALIRCLRDALPDLDENRLRRRAAIAQVLTSAHSWELMWRFWGFDGVEAGDAAAEALQIVLGVRSPGENYNWNSPSGDQRPRKRRSRASSRRRRRSTKSQSTKGNRR